MIEIMKFSSRQFICIDNIKLFGYIMIFLALAYRSIYCVMINWSNVNVIIDNAVTTMYCCKWALTLVVITWIIIMLRQHFCSYNPIRIKKI